MKTHTDYSNAGKELPPKLEQIIEANTRSLVATFQYERIISDAQIKKSLVVIMIMKLK